MSQYEEKYPPPAYEANPGYCPSAPSPVVHQANPGYDPPPQVMRQANPGYDPPPQVMRQANPGYGQPQQLMYQANPGYGPPPPRVHQTSPVYCASPPIVMVGQRIGNCPSCGQGFLMSNFTCLGVFCAIFFFPIGLLCLFLLQEQRCPTCGYCTS